MLAGIQVCLFGRYVKSLCLWREMTGYPLDTGGGNRICTWWRMEARKKHLKGNGGKTRWEGDIWGRCSMQLRGGESKVSLRWNAAGGCRKCPGVLGVGVCVGVCVCVRACTRHAGDVWKLLWTDAQKYLFWWVSGGSCRTHFPPASLHRRAMIRERKPPPSDKAALHSVGHSKLHQTVPMQKPFKTPDPTSLLAGGKAEDT